MDISLSGNSFTYSEMAQILGMDSTAVKMIYTLNASGSDSSMKLSINQIINFIIENESTFESMIGGQMSSLKTLQTIIDGVISDKSYTYDELSDTLGMNSSYMKQMFLLYTLRHGFTGNWGASPQQFVKFLKSDILTNKEYASKIDSDMAESVNTADTIINAVVSDKKFTYRQALDLIKTISDDMDPGTMKLLYTFYGSQKLYDNNLTMSIEQMFNYLNDNILEDDDFSDMIDADSRKQIKDMKVTLDDAISSLRGENYSIMSVSTLYPEESQKTNTYMANLTQLCNENLEYDHYLIGSSAMYYEMSLGFKNEMLFMTLLTAIAIFIIVLITFKSFILPTLLVLIIQCAVFITVACSYLRGYEINYLAYLIVQCILMGATIDYGILFTNNYIESRLHHEDNSILASLKYAYKASIHTILTSGLIMILVTGVVGFTSTDPSIGPICATISIGSLSAIILIVFILPGILALCDRIFMKRKLLKSGRNDTKYADNK